MPKAILGSTGFIGSSLAKQMVFENFFNSANIQEIRGRYFDTVISAANSGFKWKVNQNPAQDLDNIKNFIENINSVKTDFFVLISTIDVYKNPNAVYEDSETGADDSNAYGRNRLYLENFIKTEFQNHLIIRLPVVYGTGFKKNILFDLLNNHQVERINPSAQLQFYNVSNLSRDINKAREAKIELLNMATAPILVAELTREVFGLDLGERQEKGLIYDMRTRYAGKFGESGDYIYPRSEIIEDLKNFKKLYKNEA